jgi:hypothetical protein
MQGQQVQQDGLGLLEKLVQLEWLEQQGQTALLVKPGQLALLAQLVLLEQRVQRVRLV